jgi:nitrite reductase/ring-hydroxylating ferredoxin subunit
MGARRAAARCRRQAAPVTDPTTIAGTFLCRSDEIAEGEARGIALPGGRRPKVIVTRRHGELYAYWDACPHYGDTPMAWRTNQYLNAGRDRIVCASHGAEFDIATGRCVLGAALGRALTRAPIAIHASGDIFLLPTPSTED